MEYYFIFIFIEASDLKFCNQSANDRFNLHRASKEGQELHDVGSNAYIT